MKKILTIIALIIAFPLVSHAALTPTSWLRDTVAGFLRPNITTDTLRIPSLTSCDSIDTDADGDLACGSDAGGGSSVDGSGTTNELTYWSDADSLSSLTTAVYPSLTEVSYLKGVTSAIQTQFTGKLSTALTSANIFVGNGSNVATGVAMSGDVTINNAGATAVGADAVALATDTTGAYVGQVSTNSLTGLAGGDTAVENRSISLALDQSASLSGDISLSSDRGVFGISGLAFEGTTADTIETYIQVADPTSSDKTIVFPDRSGTISLSGDTFTGDVTGTIDTDGSTALTIGADKITESMLKAVDSATDEECLTKEDTTGDFEWQSCGAGGSFDSTTVDATTWSDGANASNAWTFDVSGTDTTWTMGSNNWIFGTGSIDLGAAGVRLSHDADGALTWLGLGDGSDEAITYNLDDVSNTIGLSSSSGLDKWNFGAIRPQFDDLNFLADANGNELLILDTVASAVNEITQKNAATGNNPGFTATGDDTNIGITMTMKGTGNLVFSSSSTGYIQLISNATARSWRTGGIYDSPGNVILGTTSAASAVNYVNVVNAGTTAAPTLSALGSDTNIDLALASKGTGNVTANGDPVLYRCEKLGLDPYSNITTGTNKDSFVMPYAMTVTAVYASLTSAPTGSVATFDINEDTDREAGGASATSILSTKLTIDATETSSQSAATPPVISDTALAKGSTISYDHDGVGSTLPGNGPLVEVCGVINP